MATQNKIIVKIDNEVIELLGAEKETFIADRNLIQAEIKKFEDAEAAKAIAKAALLERLGITAEEAALLLG